MSLDWLKNRWMNSVTYLAQAAHSLGAIAVVVYVDALARAFAWNVHRSLLLATFGVFLWAALKEFWYDATYEIPRQTFKDSALDWAFYMLGSGVALLATWWLPLR